MRPVKVLHVLNTQHSVRFAVVMNSLIVLFLNIIKGSCERLMDECFLLPLFQNKSLYKTLREKMS